MKLLVNCLKDIDQDPSTCKSLWYVVNKNLYEEIKRPWFYTGKKVNTSGRN